ncbi:hypothetical protein [Actinoplanes derwentensis]|uniref:Uncharacterized protein n=2 Tax=Actinoplanes derwentensis TaxID=113562 RepID=A0A1H1UA96_9ACTN|nr:hypothetical protein [Actinoplanes derwentensis]GID85246.1 hypothetical protein Ade03nite_41700 [Actinoplanes derwentensis]SDS69408.1 hypothetical protein SAMN04489716_1380 [Actinoplanes derwentensis]
MADPQTVRAVVARAGFTVEDFVDPAFQPEPMTVWKPFIRASVVPAVRISDHEADPDGHLDREWLRLSRENGTIADDGTVLLSVEGAGRLPWLRVRIGTVAPRASRVGLPGQSIGFVALSPDGRCATSVSTEEWETWILAADIPAGPYRKT